MALISAAPANAAFSVCNKTTHPAAVALGFVNEKGWNSAGWWNIAPGNCAQLVSQPLNARFYYLYAVHQDIGGAWDGEHSFCVKPGQFTIQGRINCAGKGYEARRFFEVDTGNSPNWTENLVD